MEVKTGEGVHDLLGSTPFRSPVLDSAHARAGVGEGEGEGEGEGDGSNLQ